MDIAIVRETPDQPEIITFFRAADERSYRLYPTVSREGPSLAALLSANIRFFVARSAGRALGCGGCAIAADATAELKRIFVSEACRGQGIGRLLVTAIEEDARCEGVRMMRL